MPYRLAVAISAIGLACMLAACGTSTSEPLPDTTWTVTSIDGDETIRSAQPTIEFGTDGTVSGTTGCNQYNGTFTVDGDRLTIGPLATTKLACDEAANAQEVAVTQALAGATNWGIDSKGDLEIRGSATIAAASAEQPET
jgi:heat shock protein HslJ